LDKSEADQLPLVYLGHDLRAALAEMQAGIRLVQQLDLPESAQQLLKRCGATGDILDRIIDQSVLVCLGQGRPDLTTPETIRVEDFLANLSNRWTGLGAESGHTFQLRPSLGLPRELYVDATALDRILTNLMSNALAHTPPCQVTLSIDYDANSNSLIVEIRDQGPGLPDAVLRALHDDAPLSGGAHPPGKGFGLSAVRYLVSAMGGTCSFANASSGGAMTRLRLPLPTSPTHAPTADAEAGAPLDLTGISLILGEDNPTCRILLETHFRKLGLALTSVEDGMEIIDRFSQGLRPDLLVLDDQMPGLSGLGVLNWIRENLAVAERPAILILTAHTTPDRALALQMAGATRVEPKQSLEAGRIGQLLRDILKTRTNPLEATTLDMSTLRRLTEIAGPLAAAELLARLERARASLKVGDPREEYRGSWSVPGATGVSDMPDDVVLAFKPDRRTCVVALTHDPKLDDLALLEALNTEAFYVGGIGSRRNNEARRARMIEHFDQTEASLQRLRGPIGIYIGSKTPAEIALSILAEIVAAKNGTLAVMAAGDQATYQTIEPILNIIGKNIFYLGADPTMGQTMKIINNTLYATSMLASCEALVYGVKAGLDPKTMLDVVNVSSGRSFATMERIPAAALDRSFPVRFTTELLHKDI